MNEDCNELCPTLHELSADLRAFKEWTKTLFEERKHLANERYKAIDSTIAGLKESSAIAFNVSDKAVNKSENAQREYNSMHNDLSRKMEAQYKDMLPRTEADRMFAALSDKIDAMAKAGNIGEGRGQGLSLAWSLLLGAVALAGALIAIFRH